MKTKKTTLLLGSLLLCGSLGVSAQQLAFLEHRVGDVSPQADALVQSTM